MAGRFSPRQRRFLEGHWLGRLATADADGQPTVTPVSFALGPDDTLLIGGWTMARTRKARDVAVNPKVSFTVDEAISEHDVRGLTLRGTAELSTGSERLDPDFDGTMLVVTPVEVVDWGLDEHGA